MTRQYHQRYDSHSLNKVIASIHRNQRFGAIAAGDENSAPLEVANRVPSDASSLSFNDMEKVREVYHNILDQIWIADTPLLREEVALFIVTQYRLGVTDIIKLTANSIAHAEECVMIANQTNGRPNE